MAGGCKLYASFTLRLFFQQKGLCAYCREPIHPETVTVEHVVPRSWQGRSKEGYNLILVCSSCQREKSKLESIVMRDFPLSEGLERCAHFVIVAMAKARQDQRFGPRQGLFHAMACAVQRCADKRFRFSLQENQA